MKESTQELREKAQRLLGALKSELEHLPDFSMFGDDNREDKRLGNAAIVDLEMFLAGKQIPMKEVYSYLYGNDDYMLSDWIF